MGARNHIYLDEEGALRCIAVPLEIALAIAIMSSRRVIRVIVESRNLMGNNAAIPLLYT